MFRKRISTICIAVIITVLLAACGRKETADSGGVSSSVTETETGAMAMEKSREEAEAEDGAGGPGEENDQAGPGGEAMEERESEGPDKQAEAFAEMVQEAVADKDMEAFADLLSYPCVFITGDQETIILQKQEDLMKQNPDMIFGDDLMVAVANVDTAALKMTEEDVTLGDGLSGITFREITKRGFGIIEIKE